MNDNVRLREEKTRSAFGVSGCLKWRVLPGSCGPSIYK